jgi:hypothetical protein
MPTAGFSRLPLVTMFVAAAADSFFIAAIAAISPQDYQNSDCKLQQSLIGLCNSKAAGDVPSLRSSIA